MKDYKIGLIVFLFLATIISFFPPFQWGDENIKTEKERIRNQNILENLPIKKYDFLFSSNKKYFPIGSYRISEIVYGSEKLRIDTSDILTKDVEEGKKGIDTFFYKFEKYQNSDWDWGVYDKKREDLKNLNLDYEYEYLLHRKTPQEIANRIADSIKNYKIFSFQKPNYYLLSREIIFSELAIEYLLAVFIAFFVQIIIAFAKRKALNEKSI